MLGALVVDHINEQNPNNKFDWSRENLQFLTHIQNVQKAHDEKRKKKAEAKATGAVIESEDNDGGDDNYSDDDDDEDDEEVNARLDQMARSNGAA